jgi:hypothetical protein
MYNMSHMKEPHTFEKDLIRLDLWDRNFDDLQLSGLCKSLHEGDLTAKNAPQAPRTA